MLLFRPLPLLMVLLLPACKETPICEGGETQLCYCPTGDAGVQICDIDGDSWEPCECIPEDSETGDGSGSGSGSGDGSGSGSGSGSGAGSGDGSGAGSGDGSGAGSGDDDDTGYVPGGGDTGAGSVPIGMIRTFRKSYYTACL